MNYITPADVCPRCGSTTSAKVADDIQIPASPVPELLGTNLTPSMSEYPSIQLTVSEGQSRISPLDAEIVRVQGILDALKAKRQAISECVKGHRALLCPIRRFPAELVSMIFLRCLELEGGRKTALNAPWVLGWICSRWRGIALSTQKLWSKPKFCLYKQPYKRDVALAKTWLARAGRCSLSITLTGDCKNVHPVLKMALDHCEQWQCLDLHLPFSMIQHFAVVRHKLPRLRRLTLQFKTGNPDMDNITVNMFEVAPLLRDVFVGNGTVSSFVKVPWDQLTSVFTLWQDFESAIDTLQQCPNLVECNIGVIWSQVKPRRPPVQLVHLRSLCVRGPADFFDYLTLPALRGLHIECNLSTFHSSSQQASNAWVLRFTSLMLRSSCLLETLNIGLGARNLEDNDLIQSLKMVPSLVELVIRGSLSTVLAGSAVGGLTCRDTGTWIAPNLKVLDVECRSNAFDCGAFAKMIQSRRQIDDYAGKAGVFSCATSKEERVPARLERVHLRINPPWDDAQLLPLRNLRDQGLDIVVDHRHNRPLL
jgi:hypothetical protein